VELGIHNVPVFPHFLIMSRRVETGRRKHLLTDRSKTLAAAALAQKIGYLRVDDFPASKIFDALPIQIYGPHRMIRIKEELLIVQKGFAEVWHTRYDRLVKVLEQGSVFGEMELLGQGMLGTRAITGKLGATVSIMNVEAAKKWIESNPTSIFAELGFRLSNIEAEHYRSQFQLADSRIAAALLEIAGQGSNIEGISHEKLGERLGLYRETVTVVLDAMKLDRLIEVGRMRITILDKRAVREMSEL
jgi:CRP-like cAMP-binding protein